MIGNYTGGRFPFILGLESLGDIDPEVMGLKWQGPDVAQGDPGCQLARLDSGLHVVRQVEVAEVQVPTNESFDHGGEYGEAAPGEEQGPEAVYGLIGRKCVALGLDFASRLFAQSLVRAMAGEMDQDLASAANQPNVPLDQSSFLAATWVNAWGNGQANLLEQAIAFVTGLTKVPEPAPVPHSPATSIEAVAQSQTPEDHPLPAPPYPDELTAREVEVLRLLTTGLSNTELACRLYLSTRTVHAHLRSIYTKIGVNTRAAATHYAVLHGLAA